jgi:hypothetical protein
VTVPALLALLSIASIEWTRTSVFAALAIVAIGGCAAIRGRAPLPHHRARPTTLIALGILAAVVAYGLLTARMSSGDLHFFWGPKAILYFQNGGVTLPVLKSTIHKYMNPDYPLLVPLLHVWSLTVARQFSWWGALLAAGVFLFACVAIVRSTSGQDGVAVLLAATLGFCVAKGCIAGGAEPVLLLFETTTLCALTLIEDRRTQTILAAIGLAGAASTKIEGATFAIAVALALVIVKRDIKQTLLAGTPAGIIVAGWMAFVVSNGISIVYHGASMPMYFGVIPRTLVEIVKVASYGVYWLPWLAAIALIILGDARRAALPIGVALLTTGAAIFFYIHSPDPAPWIVASGTRVLLTPLCAILIAAAAARPERVRSEG